MGRLLTGFLFGAIFVGIGVLALTMYGGTPHGGPTVSCGPVTFLSNTFTIQADCRYVSIAELAVAGVFFFLGMLSILAGRPK